ncbi:phosphoribosyltransferase family protein [Myxococcaceae bacterium GXIMD 01537]
MDGEADLLPWLRNVSDYPRPGILYTDVTGVLLRPELTARFVARTHHHYAEGVDKVLAVESMGFLLGGMLGHAMGKPVVISRKERKILPGSVTARASNSYKAERVGLSRESVRPGERVLIVDDVLGTGSTFLSMAKLVEALGGVVAGGAHLLRLSFLEQRPGVGAYSHFFFADLDRQRFEGLETVRVPPSGVLGRVRALARALRA